jgi:hypothetical protein
LKKYFVVNAASFGKRDVSTEVQACIDSFANITTRATGLTNMLLTYNHSQSYQGALVIQSQQVSVETYLNSSALTCGAIQTQFNADESSAIVSSFSTVVSNAVALFSGYVTAKTELSQLAPFWDTIIISTDLAHLNAGFNSLDNALVALTPADQLGAIQPYVDDITSAVNAAIAAYAA